MKLRNFLILILGVWGQERCVNNKCGQSAQCCSQFGYCGTTWEYCAAGCNPMNSFMPASCYSVSPPNIPQPKPPMEAVGAKQCSAASRCPLEAPCCSEFGYCGIGMNYCHAGCNSQGSFSPLACSGGFPGPNVYPPPSFPPLMPPSAPVIYPMNQPQLSTSITPQMRPPMCGPFKAEFERGIEQDGFILGGPVTMDRSTLSLRMVQGSVMNENGVVAGIGGFAKSRSTYGYGKYSARIRSARVGGVVSAFNLISRDGDEIDFEFVGRDENSVQTNYYYKGILDYSKGQFSNINANTHTTSHVYSITYTPELISFMVDGRVLRTVTRASTFDPASNRFLFPTSPVQIQFQIWDGGAGSQGTREWAGGLVNWKDPELIGNGGFIDMQVDWVAFECL